MEQSARAPRAPRELPGGTKGAYSPAGALWRHRGAPRVGSAVDLRPRTPEADNDAPQGPRRARIKRCESADADARCRRVSWASDLREDVSIERSLSSPSACSSPLSPAPDNIPAPPRWTTPASGSPSALPTETPRHSSHDEVGSQLLDHAEESAGELEALMRRLYSVWVSEAAETSRANTPQSPRHVPHSDGRDEYVRDECKELFQLRETLKEHQEREWALTAELEALRTNQRLLSSCHESTMRDVSAQKTLASLVHELSPARAMWKREVSQHRGQVPCETHSHAAQQTVANARQAALKEAEQV